MENTSDSSAQPKDFIESTPVQSVAPVSPADDTLEPLMQVLIFFGNICVSPILGIILYFIWKDTKPVSAKRVCLLTWVPCVILLVLTICFVAFMVIAAAGSSTTRY